MIAQSTFASPQDPSLPSLTKSRSQAYGRTASYAEIEQEAAEKQGIYVSTALKFNNSASRSNTGISEVDPFFLSRRYEKSHTAEVTKVNKPKFEVSPSNASSSKLMFERLATTHKVKVVRTIEESEDKDPKKAIMRYKLEDVDENLDFTGVDDEMFLFAKLGLEVCPVTSELRMFIKSPQDMNEAAEGFELKGLTLLRERMFDILFINGRNEKCPVGKVEFKRKKMRMYNEKKVQLYKICKSFASANTRALCVKDGKREKVSFGTLTHISDLICECEIEFPKLSKPEERLMMVAMLVALMERVERLQTSNPIKMLKRAVSTRIV